MPLIPRSRRHIKFWLQILFWGSAGILLLTLGLVALLSRDVRFSRSSALPAVAEQKK